MDRRGLLSSRGGISEQTPSERRLDLNVSNESMTQVIMSGWRILPMDAQMFFFFYSNIQNDRAQIGPSKKR
jgi:hypothetical protein